MISSFLWSMIIYCAIFLPFYIIFRIVHMRKRKINWLREGTMLLFFLYSVSIFSQTIIPDFYIVDRHIVFNTATAYSRSNFTPLKTILLYYEQLNGPLANIAFYNLAGNVVLFIPFGFFIPLLWKKFRGWVIMHVVALLTQTLVRKLLSLLRRKHRR